MVVMVVIYPLSVGIACLKHRNIEISSRSVPDAYRNLLVQPRNPECIFFYYAQYEYVSPCIRPGKSTSTV